MTTRASASGRFLDHDWWPVPLPDNVSIGERTWLYSAYAFLHYRSRRPRAVTIGSDTGVYEGTFFDLGPEGECHIGDFGTIVGPVIATNGRVVIGDYAFISFHVVIADSPFAAPPEVSATPPGAETIIGDNVWLGVRAQIFGGITVGEGAVIGAAASVDFDVPPFAIVAGNPARIVGEAR